MGWCLKVQIAEERFFHSVVSHVKFSYVLFTFFPNALTSIWRFLRGQIHFSFFTAKMFFFFSLYSFETSIKFNIVRTSARIFCGYLIYMCLLIYSCFFLYSSSFQTNFPFLCSAEFASLSQSCKKTERYGLIRLQLY